MVRGVACHNDEDIRRALTVLALHSGNTRAAARALKAQGHRVDPRTLGR